MRGLTYAIGPSYNRMWHQLDEIELRKVLTECFNASQKALKLSNNSTETEKELIYALTKKHPSKNKPDDFNEWTNNYADYMRKVKNQFPEDSLIICRDSDMDFMMSNDELKVFNDLPNKFKVYRGITESDEDFAYDEGLSWTLSEEKADWFAKRFKHNEKPRVLELEVYKDVSYPTKVGDKPKAVAYLNGREEQEIIVYNYSSCEFATMPPWEHSRHQEFYLEEQLIDTYVTYQDWLENGFIEPPKEFSKNSRMDEWPIGNDETIS